MWRRPPKKVRPSWQRGGASPPLPHERIGESGAMTEARRAVMRAGLLAVNAAPPKPAGSKDSSESWLSKCDGVRF